jgi:hypothetical protein
MRECRECRVEKPLDRYEKTGHGYFRKICMSCRSARKRTRRLPRQFGISYQDLLMMKEEQDYKCAICGIHEENTTTRLAIDHDHKTNRVRGYLCNNCNRGIGLLKDDVEVMKRAIIYLERDSFQYGGSQGGDSTPDTKER